MVGLLVVTFGTASCLHFRVALRHMVI